MIRTCSLVIATLVVAACTTTPSPAASRVQDGDPATINRDCKLLGTVSGRSMFGGGESGRSTAMLDAREKAAAMGATHVLFVNVDTSGMLNTAQATARVYRCDAKS